MRDQNPNCWTLRKAETGPIRLDAMPTGGANAAFDQRQTVTSTRMEVTPGSGAGTKRRADPRLTERRLCLGSQCCNGSTRGERESNRQRRRKALRAHSTGLTCAKKSIPVPSARRKSLPQYKNERPRGICISRLEVISGVHMKKDSPRATPRKFCARSNKNANLQQ